MFNFEGASDVTIKRFYGDEMLSLIQLDRKAVYNNDLFRSLIYVLLAAAVIWFFIKEKINRNIMVICLTALIVFDLVGIDLRYVDKDDFVTKRRMTQPFPETALDQQIKEDEGVFRVYDPAEGLNGARTSYYHQSIGGYHAAKPGGIQDLFDFHIYNNNIRVLNMLNVKYIVQKDEEGRSYPAKNPDANGNAWFVQKLVEVKSANDEILGLKEFDEKKEALVNTSVFHVANRVNYRVDSIASIRLEDYKPNQLTYTSKNPNAGVAVFSEMYYANGWNAYVDGKPKDHFRVDYVLRALKIPEGEHSIEFRFEPEIVEKGSKIAIASSILLGLIVLGGIGFSFWRSKRGEKIEA